MPSSGVWKMMKVAALPMSLNGFGEGYDKLP